MKKMFLVLMLISFTFVQAQNITLSGYITDLETDEVLIDANIYDVNSGRGTYTNNYGYFSIILPKDTIIDLRISYVGYSILQESFTLTDDISLNFSLEPSTSLEELIITSKGNQLLYDLLAVVLSSIHRTKKCISRI